MMDWKAKESIFLIFAFCGFSTFIFGVYFYIWKSTSGVSGEKKKKASASQVHWTLPVKAITKMDHCSISEMVETEFFKLDSQGM